MDILSSTNEAKTYNRKKTAPSISGAVKTGQLNVKESSYQWYFKELEQIISQFCMEIQKTSNSQSNLEKEEWNWRNQPA